VDHDPRERVFPHDELPAQVAKPDSLLTHDSTPLSERSTEPRQQGSTYP
jgi:hypothetical protein